jgi:hypothetical protein
LRQLVGRGSGLQGAWRPSIARVITKSAVIMCGDSHVAIDYDRGVKIEDVEI